MAIKNVLWRPLLGVKNELSPEFYTLMRDPNSTTKFFKEVCGASFFLKLLGQDVQAITASEAEILKISVQTALVRRISMGNHPTPWLIGRTVFHPDLMNKPAGHVFMHLGEQPLGEVLFKEPSLVRLPFEIALIESYHEEHVWITDFTTEAVWARRSVFYYKDYPILLTEFFLKSMLLLCLKMRI